MGYGMRPDIGSTNLVVECQDKKERSLIKEIKQGIYLTSRLSLPNTNGDISDTVDLGYWIENGRLAYPIKNAMLGTTIFHLLKNLVAIYLMVRSFLVV